MCRTRPIIVVFLAVKLLAGCSGREPEQAPLAGRGPQADLAFFNGRIYTGDARKPWVEAIAVREGRILALGRSDEIEPMTRGGARLVDLEGRMAMPGIVDSHVHPVWGAIEALYRCNFAPDVSPGELQSVLQACAAGLPEGAWLQGGRWGSDFIARHAIVSPRAFLDAAVGGRPVLLTDDSGHNAWANS
ncbi:MAG: amidohydrolase family protein, partial [Gammaproteobacteria bacterium]